MKLFFKILITLIAAFTLFEAGVAIHHAIRDDLFTRASFFTSALFCISICLVVIGIVFGTKKMWVPVGVAIFPIFLIQSCYAPRNKQRLNKLLEQRVEPKMNAAYLAKNLSSNERLNTVN